MKRLPLLMLFVLAALSAPAAHAQGFTSRPGLGTSTAAPVGKPFAFPDGIVLRQPIKTYDHSRPENCGNKDEKKSYGTDGNLVALCLMFTNRTGAPVTITLPPGLIFVSRNRLAQNGLLVQRVTIEVPPAAIFYAPLFLYCANGNRHGPGGRDLFDLGPVTDAPELAALFNKLASKDLSDTGQLVQGLVWSVTGEGEYNELLAMGIDALPPRAAR